MFVEEMIDQGLAQLDVTPRNGEWVEFKLKHEFERYFPGKLKYHGGTIQYNITLYN